jgi:hypothetical protein
MDYIAPSVFKRIGVEEESKGESIVETLVPDGDDEIPLLFPFTLFPLVVDDVVEDSLTLMKGCFAV